MTVQEACGLAEVGNVAPLRVVPDDEQAAARAADRDVEEVGRPGCPVTGLLGRARVGAQHEHNDVGLLPLHAVHGPDVAGGPFSGFELTEGQATALRDHVAEGAQDVDAVEAYRVFDVQPPQDLHQGAALGGNPLTLAGAGHVDPAATRIIGPRAAREGLVGCCATMRPW